MSTAKAFFEAQGDGIKSILEIGSLNVNGSMREVAPKTASYLGADLSAGPDVDVVIQPSNLARLPWQPNSFDAVISSSCLEHDFMFWQTFLEMSVVARKVVYISAPVQGPVHNHPIDCWRFYPDAGLALAQWVRYLGFDLRLHESFWLPPLTPRDIWCDFVAVFTKGFYKPPKITPAFPHSLHHRNENQL